MFVVTGINIPVPKVNPAGPYSTFHAVSAPPTVQEISDPKVEVLDVNIAVGFKQGC